MKTVLFVCIHTSARSQMAESFVNGRCAGKLQAFSAGIEHGTLNPVVVEVMREMKYDISTNATKSVDQPEIRSRSYDYVATVCDEASAEACPIYPTSGARLHWSFPDPSSFEGDREARLARTRVVRDEIADQIDTWCADVCR